MMSLNYHDVLTLPFLELWCDWIDSGQGLAWPWQPPAASCQSAAREHHVKVRDKREHVNTPNEKGMTSCTETGGDKWYCALKLINLMLLLCYQYFLYDILLFSVLLITKGHCGKWIMGEGKTQGTVYRVNVHFLVDRFKMLICTRPTAQYYDCYLFSCVFALYRAGLNQFVQIHFSQLHHILW